MTNKQQYAVIYRTGGTVNFKWNRVLGSFNREEAVSECESLERMGYPTLMHDVEMLDSIGMPETFDANDNVNWSVR
jgi:hypothetical protein